MDKNHTTLQFKMKNKQPLKIQASQILNGICNTYAKKFKRGLKVFFHAPLKKNRRNATTCHTLKKVKENAKNNLAPFSSQLLMPFQMV